MTENLEVFLRPTPAIESEHPEVAAFAREHAAAREARLSVSPYGTSGTPRRRASGLRALHIRRLTLRNTTSTPTPAASSSTACGSGDSTASGGTHSTLTPLASRAGMST